MVSIDVVGVSLSILCRFLFDKISLYRHEGVKQLLNKNFFLLVVIVVESLIVSLLNFAG